MPVRLQLLGPVALAGQPSPGPRALALGLIAALAEEPVPRADAAALLWERSPPVQAKASLRQCLVHWKSLHPHALAGDRLTFWRDRGALVSDLDELLASSDGELWADRLAGAGLPLSLPPVGGVLTAWLSEARARVLERLARAAAGHRERWTDDQRYTVERALARLGGGSAPPRPTQPARAAVPSPGADPLSRPRLMVAATEGAGAEQALGEVIRHELIAAFARARDLVVLEGRQTLDRLELPPGASHYVLAPHVTDARGGLRFTVRLLRAPSLELLWSEAMLVDTGASGVEALAGRLVGRLLPELERDAVVAPDVAGDAWRAYLEARAASAQPVDAAEARVVVARLETLVAAHPRFAGPRLALARLLNTELGYTSAGASGPAERGRAMQLVREAVRLDPGQPRCWTHLAWSHLWAGQWAAAGQALDHGLALSRLQPARLNETAFAWAHLGQLDRAEEALDASRALQDAPDEVWENALGLVRLLQGRPLEALEALEAAETLYVWTGIYALAARAAAGLETEPLANAMAGRLAVMWSGRPPDEPGTLARWMTHAAMPFRRETDRRLVAENTAPLILGAGRADAAALYRRGAGGG